MFGVDGESVQTEGGDYERSETRLRMQAQLVVREPATAPTYLRFRFGVGAERAKVVETFSFLTTNMTTEVSYRPSTEAAVGLAHDVGNASIAAEIAVNEAGTSAARFNAVFLALVGVRL